MGNDISKTVGVEPKCPPEGEDHGKEGKGLTLWVSEASFRLRMVSKSFAGIGTVLSNDCLAKWSTVQIWIRIFPHNAITQRVAETRMGAGKGGIECALCCECGGCLAFGKAQTTADNCVSCCA